MSKILKGFAAAFMFVSVVLPVTVAAQQDSAVDSTTNQATDVADSDKEVDRQVRIDAYKQRVTDRLTVVEERRIAGLCKVAQGKVSTLQGKMNDAIERRRGSYANISSKLNELVIKLQAATVDTTELEASIAEMDSQAVAIISAVDDYSATLSDLSAMDCAEDPQGFKAALTVAREQRADVVSKAQAFKGYVSGTIKSILQNIRQQLAGSASGGTGGA